VIKILIYCVQVFCWTDFNFLEHLMPLLPATHEPVFLDAGASIGGASSLFALAAGLAGHTVAMEADPSTFEQLNNNIAQFGCVIFAVFVLSTLFLPLLMGVVQQKVYGETAELGVIYAALVHTLSALSPHCQ
jgi:hypothetical protein